MLPSVVSYLLEGMPDPERFADAKRHETDNPGLVEDQDFEKLRTLFRQSLKTEDKLLDIAIGRYLTETLNTEPQEERQTTWQQLPPTLYGNSACTFAFQAAGSDAILFCNGEAYPMSAELAQSLCNNRQVIVSDVSSDDKEAVLSLYNRHTLLDEDDS